MTLTSVDITITLTTSNSNSSVKVALSSGNSSDSTTFNIDDSGTQCYQSTVENVVLSVIPNSNYSTNLSSCGLANFTSNFAENPSTKVSSTVSSTDGTTYSYNGPTIQFVLNITASSCTPSSSSDCEDILNSMMNCTTDLPNLQFNITLDASNASPNFGGALGLLGKPRSTGSMNYSITYKNYAGYTQTNVLPSTYANGYVYWTFPSITYESDTCNDEEPNTCFAEISDDQGTVFCTYDGTSSSTAPYGQYTIYGDTPIQASNLSTTPSILSACEEYSTSLYNGYQVYTNMPCGIVYDPTGTDNANSETGALSGQTMNCATNNYYNYDCNETCLADCNQITGATPASVYISVYDLTTIVVNVDGTEVNFSSDTSDSLQCYQIGNIVLSFIPNPSQDQSPCGLANWTSNYLNNPSTAVSSTQYSESGYKSYSGPTIQFVLNITASACTSDSLTNIAQGGQIPSCTDISDSMMNCTTDLPNLFIDITMDASKASPNFGGALGLLGNPGTTGSTNYRINYINYAGNTQTDVLPSTYVSGYVYWTFPSIAPGPLTYSGPTGPYSGPYSSTGPTRPYSGPYSSTGPTGPYSGPYSSTGPTGPFLGGSGVSNCNSKTHTCFAAISEDQGTVFCTYDGTSSSTAPYGQYTIYGDTPIHASKLSTTPSILSACEEYSTSLYNGYQVYTNMPCGIVYDPEGTGTANNLTTGGTAPQTAICCNESNNEDDTCLADCGLL